MPLTPDRPGRRVRSGAAAYVSAVLAASLVQLAVPAPAGTADLHSSLLETGGGSVGGAGAAPERSSAGMDRPGRMTLAWKQAVIGDETGQ